MTVTRKRNKSELEMRVSVGLVKGVDAAGKLVAQRAELNAPVDQGRLARSIFHLSPFELSRLVWATLIGSNLEYARAQEEGSGLFSEDPNQMRFIEIKPVNAKALAFAWPGGPKSHPAFNAEAGLFFFGSVMHPGVKPQPYLRPALEESRKETTAIIWSAIKAELVKS